ncbi:basic salivary proline-rich protein 1-like [Sarcophilus harrisii]|uniref:basic salivary proline-rich protein 1-like n=1 Tax=Sarcophilus harrisii TaxID=9305 RepID=UPI001301D028|nr:basic salivary proline-rich protein 1-like [Sarcophilus harrisii]
MGPQQLQPTPLVSSPFPRGSPVAAPPPGSALSAPHQVWRGGPEQEGRRFRGSRRNHGERFWNPASPQAFRTGPGLFLSARSGFLSPGGAGPHLPPTLPSLPWGPGGGPPQDQRSVPASSPRTLPPTLVMSSDCWRPRRTEQQGRSPGAGPPACAPTETQPRLTRTSGFWAPNPLAASPRGLGPPGRDWPPRRWGEGWQGHGRQIPPPQGPPEPTWGPFWQQAERGSPPISPQGRWAAGCPGGGAGRSPGAWPWGEAG